MLAIRKILPACLALFAALPAGFAYGLTIRFQREATVDTPFVSLRDIAEITGNDVANIEAYRSAKLIPAPPHGGQVFLDFDTIRNRLRALGLPFAQIEFAGASRVLIKSAAPNSSSNVRPFPGSTGEQLNNSTLGQASYAKRIVRKVVRTSLMKQSNIFDVDENEIEVHLDEQAIVRLGNTNPTDWQIQTWTPPQAGVSHLVFIPNSQMLEADHRKVECDIRMPPLVLTVRNPVPVGQTLEAADLTWMYARRSSALTQPQEVIGMQAKRNLRPGVAIQEDDLQKKPYVRPRDIVSVYARQGGITVKRTMRALKGGGLGDTVPLVSLSGNEKFIARIIGYHKTEVIDSAN